MTTKITDTLWIDLSMLKIFNYSGAEIILFINPHLSSGLIEYKIIDKSGEIAKKINQKLEDYYLPPKKIDNV